MRWTNTTFRPNMGLSRDIGPFNQHQAAMGLPQMPAYACHGHSVYWPEKATQTELIGRTMVRHAHPAKCALGSEAKLLFLRSKLFAAEFRPPDTDARGWHAGQDFCLDEDPSSDMALMQTEHVLWTKHPRVPIDPKTLGENCKASQVDAGVDKKRKASSLSRKNMLLEQQVKGSTTEESASFGHWRMTLQQAAYSNECHPALLRANDHPAYGRHGNFYVMGRGQVPTSEFPILVDTFFPASSFSKDPTATWEDLIRRMEAANKADPSKRWDGAVHLARRIHCTGGLRDCLLQDYAVLEKGVLQDLHSDVVFGSTWFQARINQVKAADPKAWLDFSDRVRHEHEFGLQIIEMIRRANCPLAQQALQLQGMAMVRSVFGAMQQMHSMMQQQQQQGGQMMQMLQQGGQRVLDAVSPTQKQPAAAAQPLVSSPQQQLITPPHSSPGPEPASPAQQMVSATQGPPPAQAMEIEEIEEVVQAADPRLAGAPLARCSDPARFSLRGVPKDLDYIPYTGGLTSVVDIMDMWDNGPPLNMPAIAAGAARMPLSLLARMPKRRWREGRDKEYDRLYACIAPGEPTDCATSLSFHGTSHKTYMSCTYCPAANWWLPAGICDYRNSAQ